MSVSRYLPSGQFTLIAGALLLSAGLVYAAEYYTSRNDTPVRITTDAAQDTFDNTDWEQTLEQIQLESGIALPEPPNEDLVAELLAAAQQGTVTDSVSRSLLVNLTSAASQGLGSDIPTQDKLIAEATRLLNQSIKATYSTESLTVVPNTKENLRAYGNTLAEALQSHPGASVYDVYYSLGSAVDNNSKSDLAKLDTPRQAYQVLAESVLVIPVPQTLVPLHLQIANGFALAAENITQMQELGADPLLAAAGLQSFNSTTAEVGRLFINLARQFSENAIIFSAEEPGSLWKGLLSTPL
jgi:hypothetical protein